MSEGDLDQRAPESELRAWCEQCNALVEPVWTRRFGSARCPKCNSPVIAASGAAEQTSSERLKAPWHFKVMVFGTLGYLVYRFIWFIFWLTGHAWHG